MGGVERINRRIHRCAPQVVGNEEVVGVISLNCKGTQGHQLD